MKTVNINVYQYDELSEDAKEKARDWYRRSSAASDQFWSEYVLEDAKEIGELMGIKIADIYWTGFWSQGDGACFVGTWKARDVKRGKAKEYAPKDEEIHRIAAVFEGIANKYPEAEFSVKHEGNYSHEFCTEFDIYFSDPTAVMDEDAEKTIVEAARDFMRWIYRGLGMEYDWQNADEQVEESIRANEYGFTAEGRRFVTER